MRRDLVGSRGEAAPRTFPPGGVTWAGLAALALATVAATADAAGKNTKYFPKDISNEELQTAMKRIKNSVGAQCSTCHVVVPAKQWEKDTPTKTTALKMLQMCDQIKKDLFTWKDAPKEATCFMCHHGKTKPEYKPESKDAEAAFEKLCKEKKHAKTVKLMEELVEKLNKSILPKVLGAKNTPKATCWTCHRGEKEPKMKGADE